MFQLSRDSAVNIVTRQRDRRYVVGISAGAEHLFLLQNIQTLCEVHLASYSMGKGVFSRG
jgi:hypothetical protein